MNLKKILGFLGDTCFPFLMITSYIEGYPLTEDSWTLSVLSGTDLVMREDTVQVSQQMWLRPSLWKTFLSVETMGPGLLSDLH